MKGVLGAHSAHKEIEMKHLTRTTGRIAAALLAAMTMGNWTGTSRAADADARVKKALDAANMKYEVTPTGSYKVVLSFSEDNRTQLTLISSSTNKYRDVEWRDVYSKAFEVKGPVAEKQANDLLAKNNDNIFGAWCIMQNEGSSYVFFQVAVPAEASATDLKNAVSMASVQADELEKKVTGKDDN